MRRDRKTGGIAPPIVTKPAIILLARRELVELRRGERENSVGPVSAPPTDGRRAR